MSDDDSLATFGWDCVFALPVADANAAIIAGGKTPPSFQYVNSDKSTIAGSFGPWQIGPDGDGMKINLAIPIHDMSVTPPSGSPITIQNATATAQVTLSFQPPLPTTPTTTPSSHELTVSQPQTSVSVTRLVVADDPPPDDMSQIRLKVGLGDWLGANLADFDHVFASIVLNDQPADTGFDWLVPTTSAYAYTQQADGTGGLLAVMCMTPPRTDTGTIWQADPRLLPAGDTASFAISINRLLGDIVRPSLNLAFPTSTPDDWSLDESTSILSLVNPIELPVVHGPDSAGNDTSYTPSLLACTISLQDDSLVIEMTTEVEISQGIYSDCHHVDAYTIGLVTKKDGTLTLGYTPDPSHSLPPDYSARDNTIKVQLPILLARLAIVIGGLIIVIATDGAALVPVLIIGGLLFGATSIVPSVIETIGTDDAPSIAPLATVGSTVSWNGTKREFRPSSATLAGGLLLAGAFADPTAIN
jgi:P-47 protein